MDAAGSAGVIFVTAWSALITAANVSQNDTVLIIGAAGGVGSAAVQIAKSRGAKVLGAVRSDADFARARANGADETITTSGNLADSVLALTRGNGADVVFDATGLLFPQSIDAASHQGRISVISAPPDGKSTFNLRNIYRKELRITGVDTRPMDAVTCAKLLAEMRPSFESGILKVNPGQPRPLSAASEAYGLAAAGKGRFYLLPNH